MIKQETPSTDKMFADLAGLLEEAGASQAVGLQAFSRAQRRRAARLARVQERLAAELKEDDPRLIKVSRAFTRAKGLERASLAESRRLKDRPKVDQDKWVVTGRFADPEGKPVAGAAVRLVTGEGKTADYLGTAETNDFGEFAIRLDRAAVARRFGKEVPDFVVEVVDPAGKETLYASKGLSFQPGHVDIFDQPLARPVKAAPPPPETTQTRPSQPKRPPRPQSDKPKPSKRS